MKTIYYTLLIISFPFLSSCGKQQDPESLYYFPNADTSFVGVKNGKGDIIIPAVHPSLNSADINAFYYGIASKRKPRVFYKINPKLIPDARYDFEKPITGLVIQFFALSKGSTADMEGPRIPAGEVYDRKGKFLYYIAGYTARQYTNYDFIFPQSFSEGYGLYVEKGKLGYVDGLGNKITPALWEYAEPFNYGYAKVFNGGWQEIPMVGYVDHKPLTDTAYSEYINNKGEIVKAIQPARSPKDYYVFNGQYLPDPFVYTEKEQQIIDSLNKIKTITYTSSADAFRTQNEGKSIHFEITARPKAGFPYYYVQGYWEQSNDAMYTFLIHQDTKEIYHYGPQFFLTDEKIPLAQWMMDGLQKVKQNWSTDAPGIKLKINIDKELEYWQSAQKEEK
jgi:hypothetical protein